MKKRFLSAFVVLALICSMIPPAYAANNVAGAEKVISSYTQEIEGGDMFALLTDAKSVAILTNDNENLIRIAIVYLHQPDVTYEWIVTEYSELPFKSNEGWDWEEIVDYAEEHLNNATLVQIDETIYDDPVEISGKARSSAVADLKEELASILSDEYYNMTIYKKIYDGNNVVLKQSMMFQIYENGYFTWREAISVGALIAKTGATLTQGNVKAICSAFGIGLSALSMLPANGAMNRYYCTATEYRCVHVNDSTDIYNITHRYINYDAYEDASFNNDERAYIDQESRYVLCPDGDDYYLAYETQVEDGYDNFLAGDPIG